MSRWCRLPKGAKMANEPVQPLKYPPDHDQRMAFTRRVQKYFDGRFPYYEEFARFLEANPKVKFNENSFYECSMSACAGGSVSEGYASDIDKNAPDWFRLFEKTVGGDECISGQKLLEILAKIDPHSR
jgi:hypothetical protein